MNSSQRSEDSGNFYDSYVSHPINLHAPLRPPNNQSSSLSQQHFGDYEPYKLSEFVRVETEEKRENQVMLVVAMEDQGTLIQGHQFGAVLKKYSAYDLVFVTVAGAKNVGKSFFCDKILNLAEIKGNHFTRAAMPGLYMSKTPFFHDDMCIFLMQIGGCQYGTSQHQILSFFALLLSSSIVLVGDYKDPDFNMLKAFEAEVQQSLSSVNLGEEGMQKKYVPELLFSLLRKDPKTLTTAENNPYSSHFFANIHNYGLPSAMTPNFAGQISDLLSLPFLNKNSVSPSYIQSVHHIFTRLLDQLEPKNLPTFSLIINGNIAYKLIQGLVTKFNSHRQVNLKELQTQIVKELYISAYNFCVVGYQKELEEYFFDEQPKDIDEILNVFGKAADSALQRFDQFNLCKAYAEQYEIKLQNHIEEKQKLILAINQQKTQQQLYAYMIPLLQKPNKNINSILTLTKSDLNHNRSKAISLVMKDILKNGKGNDVNQKMILALQKYQKQVEEKKETLQIIINQKKAAWQIQKKKYAEVKSEEKALEYEIEKTKAEISILKKRLESVKKGEGLKELKEEKQKLFRKQTSTLDQYHRLKSENEAGGLTQQRSLWEGKIDEQKKRQSKLKADISTLTRQLPMMNNQGQNQNKSSMKPNSKVK